MVKHERIAKSPATYDDVLAAPPHMVAELIDGALILQPRPAMPHARTSSVLGSKIGGPFDWDDGPGGWIILDEPEVHLGGNVVVPDIAGWRRDRASGLLDGPYAEVAPDWACEILSPSTRVHDLTGKRDLYRAYDVEHLWFVDPIAQTLEAFRNRSEGWVLIAALADDDTVAIPPFEAAPFDLAALWPPEADG